MPTPTVYTAACASAGVMAPKKIYVIGGGFTEPTDFVHKYDPTLDSWSAGTPMPTNRTAHAIGVVNDAIYAMGGHLGWEGGQFPFSGHELGVTNVVEQYIPLGYGTIPPEPEPFPTTVVATVAVSVAVVGLGFLFYFKKSRTKNNRVDAESGL